MRLNLTDNKLKVISEKLSNMQKLSSINLNENPNLNLRGVFDIVSNISSMKILLLRYNEWTSLPENLSKLSKLQVLDLQGNKFSVEEQERIRKALPDVRLVW